jgi:hypothetical protein
MQDSPGGTASMLERSGAGLLCCELAAIDLKIMGWKAHF